MEASVEMKEAFGVPVMGGSAFDGGGHVQAGILQRRDPEPLPLFNCFFFAGRIEVGADRHRQRAEAAEVAEAGSRQGRGGGRSKGQRQARWVDRLMKPLADNIRRLEARVCHTSHSRG